MSGCPEYASLAQLVEQHIRNVQVAGSSPAGSSTAKRLPALTFRQCGQSLCIVPMICCRDDAVLFRLDGFYFGPVLVQPLFVAIWRALCYHRIKRKPFLTADRIGYLTALVESFGGFSFTGNEKWPGKAFILRCLRVDSMREGI